MSVNPPADGGYQYYHKNFEELEEEMQTQQKRANERFEAREASFDEANEREAVKKQEALERTVQNVKDNMNETIKTEREYNKAEVDRIKAQTYDKWGRYNGQEADVLKQELASTVDAYNQDKKDHKMRSDDTDKANHARIGQLNREHGQALESQAKVAHDSADAMYTRRYGNEKAAYDVDHKASQKQYSDLNRQRMDDLNFQRREYESALTEARANYEHRFKKTEETNEERFNRQQRAYDDRAENAIRDNNDSHSRETKIYRDQVKDMIAAQGDYVKGRGEGQADAVKEYENQWREVVQSSHDAFGKEIDNLKYKSKQEGDYFNHLHNSSLKEKDAYFSKLIANQNLENHLSSEQLRVVFDKDREQLVLRNQRDREQSTATLESQLREANLTRNKALEHQAKAYQGTIENIRDSDDTKIKLLEKQLHTNTTSEDVNDISPAAEAAVRKSVIREYEKTFGAESERNSRTVDSIQKEYGTRLQDTVYQAQSKENEVRQNYQSESHRERRDLLQAMQDTEFMKKETLRNKDMDHQRENQNANRSYAQTMDRQRKQYEEILGADKTSSLNKLQDQRQQLQFEKTLAQREFKAQQSETIRTYEKKLNDQKAEHEAVVSEVKMAAEKQVRDHERIAKQELDQVTRTAEQRITQAEHQHKERERYITATYQTDLERTKRSNADLIRRKS